jgi:hypothetical protein
MSFAEQTCECGQRAMMRKGDKCGQCRKRIAREALREALRKRMRAAIVKKSRELRDGRSSLSLHEYADAAADAAMEELDG